MRIARLPRALQLALTRFLSPTDLAKLDRHNTQVAQTLAAAARLFRGVPSTADACRARLRAVMGALPLAPTAADRFAAADCVGRIARDTLEPALLRANWQALNLLPFWLQLEPLPDRATALFGRGADRRRLTLRMSVSPGRRPQHLTRIDSRTFGPDAVATVARAVALLVGADRRTPTEPARDRCPSFRTWRYIPQQAALLWALVAVLGDRVTVGYRNALEPDVDIAPLLAAVRDAAGPTAHIVFTVPSGDGAANASLPRAAADARVEVVFTPHEPNEATRADVHM